MKPRKHVPPPGGPMRDKRTKRKSRRSWRDDEWKAETPSRAT